MSDQGNRQETPEMSTPTETDERVSAHGAEAERALDGLDAGYLRALAAHMPEQNRRTLLTTRPRPIEERARTRVVATEADWKDFHAQRAAERAREWAASVPRMYAEARVDKLAADQHPDKLRAWWTSGRRNLLLRSSTVGNGKTHAAYAVANEVCARVWVEAWTVADLVAAIRPGEHDVAVWRAATRCSLLILDDLGQEYTTDWVREHVHRLLDQRARDGKRTIITTNLNGTELEERYQSAALLDRLVHDTLVIEFTGPSRRQPVDWGDL